MNTLKTLEQIKAALNEDGAMLVYDARIQVQSYYVQSKNGVRTRCSKLADRLTYAKNAVVKVTRRIALARIEAVVLAHTVSHLEHGLGFLFLRAFSGSVESCKTGGSVDGTAPAAGLHQLPTRAGLAGACRSCSGIG